MEHVAFFFHIIGVLSFVSGIIVAGVGFELGRRRERPEEIALLLGMTRIGVVLVGLGTILAGSFGLWLVHLGGWSYGSNWVTMSIGLFVLALVLGGLGGQKPKQARRLASELAGRGEPVTPELRALLDDRVTQLENYASFGLILAIIAIMCFKP